MQTSLTDLDSSFVKNEMQAIDITSTLIPEAYEIALSPTFNDTRSTNVTGVVQTVLIQNPEGFDAPFTLSLYGTQTAYINYGASARDVEAALNDLPFLYPNLATVEEDLADGMKSFWLGRFI